MFREFPTFLNPGSCLVLNDSKVLPSRLIGRRANSGEVEVLLVEPVGSNDSRTWTALVRPGRKIRIGDRISFGDIEVEIVDHGEFGERTVRFPENFDVPDWLEKFGHIPLPPYIKRADNSEDRERYQTVFASERGSIAAPTAGLHFTPEILKACQLAGAQIAHVTLHVGLGTFQPVRGDTLHSERFFVSEENAAKLRSAARVLCAGTTSVRAVESMYQGRSTKTDLFIRPGFDFQRTNAMLTNFHLPQSSLLMLVCAFAGQDLVLSAYRHAVEAGYRFYSYGDCMLIV